MKIIVLNCGSSSIKYQLFEMPSKDVLAKGLVDKIGLKGSLIKHERSDGVSVKLEGEILDHQTGIEYLLGILTSEKYGSIKSINEIDAFGHRVVHAGEAFKGSVSISPEVVDALVECIDLAPLHNPPNLEGIYSVMKLLPEIHQVGADKAFDERIWLVFLISEFSVKVIHPFEDFVDTDTVSHFERAELQSECFSHGFIDL